MADEFVARKGLIIKSVVTGTTEANVLVKSSTDLVKVSPQDNFVLNITDVWPGTEKITGIVTLTQAEYDAIPTKNPYLMYIVSGTSVTSPSVTPSISISTTPSISVTPSISITPSVSITPSITPSPVFSYLCNIWTCIGTSCGSMVQGNVPYKFGSSKSIGSFYLYGAGSIALEIVSAGGTNGSFVSVTGPYGSCSTACSYNT